MNTPGIVVLAAGVGSRFTRAGGQGNKLLAPQQDNQPLLALTLQQALASGLPLLLVTRPEYQDVLDLAQRYGVSAITLASNGSGESIAAAVRQTRRWSGWLIQPGDMAWVTAQDYRHVAALLEQGAPQIRLYWAQQPGHPVGFAACYGEALSRLSGDNGARALLDGALLLKINAHAGVIRDADLPVVTNHS